jgi:hypothetical protein
MNEHENQEPYYRETQDKGSTTQREVGALNPFRPSYRFLGNPQEFSGNFAEAGFRKAPRDSRLKRFDRLDNFLRIETAVVRGSVGHIGLDLTPASKVTVVLIYNR